MCDAGHGSGETDYDGRGCGYNVSGCGFDNAVQLAAALVYDVDSQFDKVSLLFEG